MRYVVPAAIAIGVGLVTLLGYFIQVTELVNLRLLLVNWAVILAGLAVIVGLLNVILTHFRRIRAASEGSGYSMLTIVAAVTTFLIGAGEGLRDGSPRIYESNSLTGILFNGVIVASQAALSAMIVFFLITAAMQLLRNRPDAWSVLFLVSVLITLIGWLPFSALSPIAAFRDWYANVPVLAGARGILLGMALGTLAVGLRVLTGTESPYKN
jgi:hypothetical protein